MTTNKILTTASLTKTPSNARPQRLHNVQMVQNFHLVWLDGSIDETNDNCRSFITKLRQIVNTINMFVDADECIDFITDVKEKVFMIISGPFSRTIISIIQDISQVSCIYIFSQNNMQHEEWPKVSGVYTDITHICETLKQAIQDCEHNSVSMNFIKKTDGTASQSLDTLDSSFMYTQILKEILLTIDFKQVYFNEFITYCRKKFVDNYAELKHVDMIEQEYGHHQPIWWYTYPCFLYSMLNRALRTMEADLITTMGFFVRNLHEHIAALHSEQYDGHHHSDSFIVYRGQGLSQTDFDQLQTTQGGLLAFNNFLSTSKNCNVSLRFARRTINISDNVGVLFVIKIDPSISATPFANIKNVSRYQGEEEILFSMHSVFRIGQVKQIEKNNHRLWHVELILTSDNDPQLQDLTKSMQRHTAGSTGWFRLGRLMMTVAQYDKAEQVFEMILNQTSDEKERCKIYYYLGWIKNYQGKYTEATTYYEKSLKIQQTNFPANHPDLAITYSSIGSVYINMGEYSKALSYHEKVLEIRQKALPENHPSLANSYDNIGDVYMNMGEYSKALSYYEKDLEISQTTLPGNHPHLATSHNNIGGMHYKMGEYSKALSYYEKALEIQQKTLPANHPELATTYNNIGLVYDNMGKYSKALLSHEKALEIRQKALPQNHPSLATSYDNIGLVYHNMGEYSKALSYHEKALEICQKTLPANHPDLATSYNHIGSVYYNMGAYLEALSYLERTLNILQCSLPPNHPSIKTVKENVEIAKKKCK
jgi:tetratricopeptide (TPR) repeat protein